MTAVPERVEMPRESLRALVTMTVPTNIIRLFCLILAACVLAGCRREPAVSTQELKSWSSNIEVRVLMLESNQASRLP